MQNHRGGINAELLCFLSHFLLEGNYQAVSLGLDLRETQVEPCPLSHEIFKILPTDCKRAGSALLLLHKGLGIKIKGYCGSVSQPSGFSRMGRRLHQGFTNRDHKLPRAPAGADSQLGPEGDWIPKRGSSFPEKLGNCSKARFHRRSPTLQMIGVAGK